LKKRQQEVLNAHAVILTEKITKRTREKALGKKGWRLMLTLNFTPDKIHQPCQVSFSITTCRSTALGYKVGGGFNRFILGMKQMLFHLLTIPIVINNPALF
jgi:hypothetical protein